MSKTNVTPKKMLVLAKSARIKVYVHPTRITILRLLAARKRTVSSVARELGVHPANLTHHFKLLEKTGLIRLVERRDIGKNIEKYYRATARAFVVRFDANRKSSKKALALSILRNDLSEAVSALRRDDTPDIIALIRVIKILPRDLPDLQKKIVHLIREFAHRDPTKGRPYTINISVHSNETPYNGREEIIFDE
jgi:DNA-binding transcriptional ArsR family regulator